MDVCGKDPVFQARRNREIVRDQSIINALGCTESLMSHIGFSFLGINPLAHGHSLAIPKSASHTATIRVITTAPRC